MSDAAREGARSLRGGLMKVAGWQVAATAVVATAAIVLLPPTTGRGVAAGLVVVLGAMLIGFVPLRILLSLGPENIIAGWIAAMILRMFATLIGLVLLIKRYGFDVKTCVWTVCGGYLLLLAVETRGMIRLMRRVFAEHDARQAAESGER